jgi:hypothetical protein
MDKTLWDGQKTHARRNGLKKRYGALSPSTNRSIKFVYDSSMFFYADSRGGRILEKCSWFTIPNLSILSVHYNTKFHTF